MIERSIVIPPDVLTRLPGTSFALIHGAPAPLEVAYRVTDEGVLEIRHEADEPVPMLSALLPPDERGSVW